MSISEIKPFKQVPSCDPETLLTITAAEYDTIQTIVNIFKPGVLALESVFNRNLNNGNIVIKYIQEAGSEITEEQATEYLKEITEHLKAKEEK